MRPESLFLFFKVFAVQFIAPKIKTHIVRGDTRRTRTQMRV